ncbi:MAG: hypothetical protein FJ390_03260 [Verrucomicrobia bacterium]|nr:hypothetical protein [Verrucomicrobiota bacterium]
MKVKTLCFHLLVLSTVLTSYSLAQSSSDYSSISSSPSSQEETLTPQELNVDLFSSKNASKKLKVGEELVIKVDNPHDLYHSGELGNVDLYEDLDLHHALCNSFYSDSWNPLNCTFSLEKENNLNQKEGTPLTFHVKAVRPGNTYIYFCTLYKKITKYGDLLMPDWLGPKVTVEVSE